MFRKNKGFTLIELLVVVAVIGVLATIIISSLGKARTKAKAATAASYMSTFRTTVAENFPDTYANLCSSSLVSEMTSVISENGADVRECNSGSNDYRIIISLPSSVALSANIAYAAAGDSFCINSNGSSNYVESSQLIGSAATHSYPSCGTPPTPPTPVQTSPLSGQASFWPGDPYLNGFGASFSSELEPGDMVQISDGTNFAYVTIDNIAWDNSAVLTGNQLTDIDGNVIPYDSSTGSYGGIKAYQVYTISKVENA